jgi:hypothetical protein
MSKKQPTFEELRDLLLRLGFREAPPEPDRLRFMHPTTGTILLFRPQQPGQTVTDREMVVVRRQLVDNGLIDAGAFDRFAEKVSA